MINDVGHVREGLDVVHDGRLAPEARHLWEWRFGARVGALALERVQQSGLLAAHISPRADVEIHLQAVAGTEMFFPR